MEELLKIQQELKAPKWQFNSFGGYKYRSCEDILSAVKPLLEKYKVVLVMKDEIVECESIVDYTSNVSKDGKTSHTEYHWPRFYVRAIASLYGLDGKEIMSSSAFAREDQDKPGMDVAQVTWSSSSFARKYALCWLFAIDDGVDPDSTNKWEAEKPAVKKSDDDKPWFNDPDLDKFTKYASNYSVEEGIKTIRTKYKLSKDMEKKVRALYVSLDTIGS